MTDLASPQYAEIQRQFHLDRPDYGVSGVRYSDNIQTLAKRLNTRDILDYGCGKATLQKNLPFPIQNYDPFMEEYCARPNPAQLVVCTDVMEHVEPEFIQRVLGDIHSLTEAMVFMQIATGPAAKTLPDGRNAHLIQENINWWLLELIEHFETSAVQDLNGGFLYMGIPKVK